MYLLDIRPLDMYALLEKYCGVQVSLWCVVVII